MNEKMDRMYMKRKINVRCVTCHQEFRKRAIDSRKTCSMACSSTYNRKYNVIINRNRYKNANKEKIEQRRAYLRSWYAKNKSKDMVQAKKNMGK